METVLTQKRNSKSEDYLLNDVLNSYKENFGLYAPKPLNDTLIRVKFIETEIAVTKDFLKETGLSKALQASFIKHLGKLNTIHEILTTPISEIFTTIPENLEDYPPYHLHKKAQSAFGAVGE